MRSGKRVFMYSRHRKPGVMGFGESDRMYTDRIWLRSGTRLGRLDRAALSAQSDPPSEQGSELAVVVCSFLLEDERRYTTVQHTTKEDSSGDACPSWIRFLCMLVSSR
jgi:hypothetical protein